jgi:hypothetical protein
MTNRFPRPAAENFVKCRYFPRHEDCFTLGRQALAKNCKAQKDVGAARGAADIFSN